VPQAALPNKHNPRVDLCGKIENFGQLMPGWHGDDAIVPSREAIHKACAIVSDLPPGVGLPRVNPSPDGEISLTWVNGPKRLNAIIDPDLHLVWATRLDDQIEEGADIDLHASSPSPLIDAVRSFYR